MQSISFHSISTDRITIRQNTVSRGRRLSPNPRFSNVIMIEVPPEVILTTFGLFPTPIFLDIQIRSIHIRNVVPISKSGKFSSGSIGSLAQIISNTVAGNLQATNRVSHSNNSTSPALIKGVIRVSIGRKISVIVVEGPTKHLMMDDASHRQALSTGGISKLWVTAVA